MEENKIIISTPNVVMALAGVITRMAPGYKPRNLDKIVSYVNDYLWQHADEKCRMSDGFYCYDSIDYKWFEEMLYDCLEFRQLNISQKLWDMGVRDCDDERNRGFAGTFVGHSDDSIQISQTPWYSDFIDLDACIPHIYNTMMLLAEEDSKF